MSELSEPELIALVEGKAQELCEAVKRANEAQVPDSLLLPALIAVFQQAGMIPDLDLSSLLGMLR